MTAIARVGDLCTGHGDCSPREIITGSTKLFIQGVPVARVGDSLQIHCDHPGTIVTGSNKMTIEGMFAARVGDQIDCGSSIMTGDGKFDTV